ncbi:MAG: hydroxymethylbilane synthase [Methanomassiliicoccales archaeon]
MIVGTRGSDLARAQARELVEALRAIRPGLEVEVRVVRTTGDRVTDRPLSSLGGFGAFVKELDQRLLEGQVDVAVNSLKDMPVEPTPGTALSAVLPRGPVEDVLVPGIPLDDLPKGAVVGSSSVRRRAQILNLRPDLEVRDIRGNVNTRLSKLGNGYDAIVLARAGLVRLGLQVDHEVLDPTRFVPAPGQGAIAGVTREGESDLLEGLNHRPTWEQVRVERALLKALGGGCSVPIGIWASGEGRLRVIGVALAEDGSTAARVDRVIDPEDGEALISMADELREGMT